jgi:hypothetical protein
VTLSRQKQEEMNPILKSLWISARGKKLPRQDTSKEGNPCYRKKKPATVKQEHPWLHVSVFWARVLPTQALTKQ